MEPNSIVLIVLLLLVCVGLLVLTVRVHRLVLRLITGTFAVALAMLGGMAVVNDEFGYYQSWSALTADLSGSYQSFADVSARPQIAAEHGSGRLLDVPLDGRLSHIDRNGLVYLPPQYDQPAYAHTRFPVVELLHGTPGNARAWVIHLQVARVMDELISRREMGPVVLVIPATYTGTNFQECTDGPHGLDDTYLTTDVRADILARFRVSPVAQDWGVAGYSSGGYCAANLTLRHRSDWGAAGIMDGYFRPGDGEAAAALDNNPVAMAANDPLLAASRLTLGQGAIPPFWVSVGTGNASDLRGAQAFVTEMRAIEQVPLELEPGAGHNFYAWQASLPHLLTWMWQQLAPPELRTAFPITGKDDTVVLPARSDWIQHRHETAPGVPATSTTSTAPKHPSAATTTHKAAPGTAHRSAARTTHKTGATVSSPASPARTT